MTSTSIKAKFGGRIDGGHGERVASGNQDSAPALECFHRHRMTNALSGRARGFTMVEILVVLVILAILAFTAVSVMRSIRTSANQARCMGNLRQIGAALHLYAADHHGTFPETSHTADLDSAWIYQLSSYLGDFEEIRVCPADPKRQERIEAKGTSYVLNSYIFVPEIDPFGQPIGRPLNRLQSIPHPERTLLAFICSDRVGTGPGNDHTHSNQWSNWDSVCADISPGRFGGSSSESKSTGADLTENAGDAGNQGSEVLTGRANYLFADGHVESISAASLKLRVDAGENIALPPGL